MSAVVDMYESMLDEARTALTTAQRENQELRDQLAMTEAGEACLNRYSALAERDIAQLRESHAMQTAEIARWEAITAEQGEDIERLRERVSAAEMRISAAWQCVSSWRDSAKFCDDDHGDQIRDMSHALETALNTAAEKGGTK